MTQASSPLITESTILSVEHFSDKLFSFEIARPEGFTFKAGQFARLGLPLDEKAKVWRAYSMLSAENDPNLRFLSIVVPNGQMTSRLKLLQAGNPLYVHRQPYGFFTEDRLSDAKVLCLLATGTGIAPFLSILQKPDIWLRFEKIVLVYGVRYQADLVFEESILQLQAQAKRLQKQLLFFPVITREVVAGVWHERIPTLIEQGDLFNAVGVPSAIEDWRWMICGNPQMVEASFKALIQQNYQLSRLKNPGQVVIENGW